MNDRQSRKERAATLRASLQEVQIAEHWRPYDPSPYIDVAVRRWISADRRLRPAKRAPENQVQDLLKGLREAFDDIYLEPGWLEHLAERFAAALRTADRAGDTAADAGHAAADG